MKLDPIVRYDEDADVLYFSMYNPPLAADDSRGIGDFIWRYKNEKVIGLTVLNFMKPDKEASGDE